MSKTLKNVAVGALVGFGIGYGFSKFVLKTDKKATLKHAAILAGFGIAYKYFSTPKIEITSNASGKKKKEKDVASPKANTKKPESWWQDSAGNWHWVNRSGKLTN